MVHDIKRVFSMDNTSSGMLHGFALLLVSVVFSAIMTPPKQAIAKSTTLVSQAMAIK